MSLKSARNWSYFTNKPASQTKGSRPTPSEPGWQRSEPAEGTASPAVGPHPPLCLHPWQAVFPPLKRPASRLRPDCESCYLMLVPSIQLNGCFGHFHGLLDGLCATVCCCHGYAALSSSCSLPATVTSDCKQNQNSVHCPLLAEAGIGPVADPSGRVVWTHSSTRSCCHHTSMPGSFPVSDAAVDDGEDFEDVEDSNRVEH